ncbi:nitronate monooxygenase [Diaminobutyricibacter tongyongensis]|uniref:Propionate 3-nitronate monooxygenase n=1 Tax=Leifsonia tongyongensis TaxID=1268043 RepID=A0A6L9XWV7_9MICO|nr:nitronate monooxygenase [Diaminobutyricibacter tongyongensis]
MTSLLGIDIPVLLGPFGGMSSAELTADVSEYGGLGAFGLYGYDAERIGQAFAAIRARTARPFAVNLWLTGDEPAISDAEFDTFVEALRPFFDELGIPVPSRPARFLPTFAEQLEAVIASEPAVISFVYGVPPAEVVDAARARGIVLLGTATTVDEAVALERSGVDVIVATGMEAAGHRVSFLRVPEESIVGTFALIPQVVDAVRVPVVAAGGIADRRGVRAAFALGASGVQVGTAFLATRQSAANDAHRQAIAEASADASVLTRAMSGRLARGLPNRAIRSIEAGRVIAPFPIQNWLTGQFRAEAVRRGIGELQSLWLGQAAPLARHTDARDVFDELAAGVPPLEPSDDPPSRR